MYICSTKIRNCYIYFLPDLRNLRRNLSEEIYHSGWTRTLSWIFNWKVPKVAHPSPVDVALNNYSHYATKIRSNHHHRRKSSQEQSSNTSKWSRRKRKKAGNSNHQLTNQQDIMSQHYLPHQPPTPPSFPQISQRNNQHQQLSSFQQRKSSAVTSGGNNKKSQQYNSQHRQPYVYEPPLSYYDASQVYFYPSQKSN